MFGPEQYTLLSSVYNIDFTDDLINLLISLMDIEKMVIFVEHPYSNPF
jgi:hypothetical protein